MGDGEQLDDEVDDETDGPEAGLDKLISYADEPLLDGQTLVVEAKGIACKANQDNLYPQNQKDNDEEDWVLEDA